MSELEQLPPEVAALLDAERARPDVPEDVRTRVVEHVRGTIAAGLAGAVTASAGSNGGAGGSAGGLSGATLRRILSFALTFGAGAASGAMLYATLEKPPTVAPPVVSMGTSVAPSASAPRADATTETASSSAVPVESLPRAASTATIGPRPSAAPTLSERDADLAAERAQIEMARTALTRGQTAAALEALQAHASQFPRGRLAEERDALWVQALAQAGRRGEAATRVERFRETYPQSLLLPMVQAAVGD
jgi:hypothetical protein